MRRPTRTRRLSITAMVSLLAFAAVAVAGARSFWIVDRWKIWTTDVENFGDQRTIELRRGHIYYLYDSVDGTTTDPIHESFATKSTSWPNDDEIPINWSFAGFSERHFYMKGQDSPLEFFCIAVPFWFPLLLLLIIPIRWLIARPANASAFPVITDAKPKSDNRASGVSS